MRRHSLLAALGAAALAGATALAGSFTSDFSNPNQTGFTLAGGVRPDGINYFPAIENGYLAMTYAESPGEQSSIVLDDLDGGVNIEAFTASFKLQLGPGSGNAADGLSFCFGPDVTAGVSFGEEGTGNGVIVSFDIYDNGGGEAPAVDVKYGGATLGTTKYVKADMVNGTFENVIIQVKRNGTISVTYKGQKIYDNLVLPDYAPTYGYFGIGARTGGENAEQRIDDLSITTTVEGTTVGPSITTHPQSQTVNEGEPATFAIDFDGTAPLTFQWLKNNVDIAGANSPTYTVDRTSAADNGAKFKCTVSNGVGSATSNEATLTVNSDVTPPTLVSVRGSLSFTAATIAFSEPLDPTTAQQASNYQIPGLTVSAAVLAAAPNDNTVVLTTSQQTEGAQLTLTVNNVKDLAGNAIAANSQLPFRTYVFMPGAILHKKYNNFDDGLGGNPANLFADPRYPNAPDRADLMAAWEYPANGAGRVAADPLRNYFDTLEGYFIPPTTGSYVFLTAGADRWWLYLSTDDDPANTKLIAAEPGGWSDARGWTQIHSGSLESRRSDQYAATEWPEWNTINLTGGQRYYMLQVHHDPSWCGGDFYGTTYIRSGDADPANGSVPTLAGSVVGCYVDPSESEINITQQPANATQEAGRSALFSVVATGSDAYGGVITFQWQRQAPGGGAWVNLTGATAAAYETPLLTVGDSGAKYRVACAVAGLVVNSAEATVTVVTDVAGPELVGAGALASQTGNSFDVGVSFDEVLDPVSAGTQANYSLSAGTITGIKFYAGSPGVVLTASGLTVGNTYTITVSNVKDVSGNTMTAPASKAFKVSAMKWGVVGGNEAALGNGVLATAENGFDVYSDGVGEWGTYDETTFVYEEINGNFDKVVRVEYQDASSQWARAGLIVRDVTNFGVDRTAQGTEAGRYQKVHVNPVKTATGTAGNNSWEGNRRLTTGGVTDSAGNGGTPLYPNAWCRLKRDGDLFTIFRSNDGITWTQQGTTTFPQPMPATVYVGPEYSPELGNLASTEWRVYVAKFRDYGDYGAVVTPTIGVAGDVITYTGVLRSSATVDGTYAPVAGATSPYTVPKTGTAMFYRTSSQ